MAETPAGSTSAQTVEAFTCDAVRNRLSGPAPQGAYTYNVGHQLLSGPTAQYAYDANGNRTQRTDASGTTTYTWDAQDRLVQVVLPPVEGVTMTVSFAYDHRGRRVRKTVSRTGSPPVVTDYVYDEDDVILIVETPQAAGAVSTVTRVVHGPDVDEPLLVGTGGRSTPIMPTPWGASSACRTARRPGPPTRAARRPRASHRPDGGAADRADAPGAVARPPGPVLARRGESARGACRPRYVLRRPAQRRGEGPASDGLRCGGLVRRGPPEPDPSAAAAVAFLHEILVPLYQRAGLTLTRVLTDGASKVKAEFDEACTALGIRHTRTKPRHAWTNGFVERLQQTILTESWRIQFRRRYFTRLVQLETALQDFLRFSNGEWPHQGYRLQRRTLASVSWGAVPPEGGATPWATLGRLAECQHHFESEHAGAGDERNRVGMLAILDSDLAPGYCAERSSASGNRRGKRCAS